MNCSHCHEKIAPDYFAPWCPYCGRMFAAPSKAAHPPSFRKFNWLFFCIVLSLPAIVVLIMLGLIAVDVNTMAMASIFGSIVSGVVCAIVLARWKGGTIVDQVFTAILLSVVLAVVSFGLCCLGCTITGLIV